ncbi:MAG: hypothetical protein NWF11_02570 [Candidatus Bathyarchaeota archaeon]|nr:hypothetical protein [Candidatus Bathyarchaeota archaeon]
MREEAELFKLLDENKIIEAAKKLKSSSKEELENLLLEARMADRVVQGKMKFLWDKIDSGPNLHRKPKP